jgi:hypothetical protein
MYCQLSSNNNNNETVVRIRSHFSRFVDGSGCARVRRRGGSLRLAGPFGSSRLAGGSRSSWRRGRFVSELTSAIDCQQGKIERLRRVARSGMKEKASGRSNE